VPLHINESPSEGPDRSVEIRGFGRFEIDEKAPDPWREMLIEEDSVSAVRRRNVAADQSRHYLTEKAGMVLRLDALWRLFDAKRLERLPNPGQRAPVQRVRQIVRGIGQQGTPPQSAKESHILARNTFLSGLPAASANAA
jgi:hypothetical protein